MELSSKNAQMRFLGSLGFKGTHKTRVKRFQRAYNLGKRLEVDGIPGPLTVSAMLKVMKRGGMLSYHFHADEFRCPCGGKYKGCKGVIVERKLLRSLEAIRKAYYPNGLHVISGYRCEGFNAAIGGIKGSEHTKGRAADLPKKVHWKDWDIRPRAITQVGFSKWDGKVCHVDVKNVPFHFFLDTAGSMP